MNEFNWKKEKIELHRKLVHGDVNIASYIRQERRLDEKFIENFEEIVKLKCGENTYNSLFWNEVINDLAG